MFSSEVKTPDEFRELIEKVHHVDASDVTLVSVVKSDSGEDVFHSHTCEQASTDEDSDVRFLGMDEWFELIDAGLFCETCLNTVFVGHASSTWVPFTSYAETVKGLVAMMHLRDLGAAEPEDLRLFHTLYSSGLKLTANIYALPGLDELVAGTKEGLDAFWSKTKAAAQRGIYETTLLNQLETAEDPAVFSSSGRYVIFKMPRMLPQMANTAPALIYNLHLPADGLWCMPEILYKHFSPKPLSGKEDPPLFLEARPADWTLEGCAVLARETLESEGLPLKAAFEAALAL